jgi:addiction module RelE/StbE family toxin
MIINYSKKFVKQFKKLKRGEQERANAAIIKFAQNPKSPPPHLRVHALKGKWAGCQSISAGGDLRVHFLLEGKVMMICTAVGSHSQLY